MPSTRRRPVFDPRLILGLLLVAASVVGVVSLVAAADRTVPVLAAREALVPGDRLEAADLLTVEVRLDQSGSRYIPADALPAGAVVTRPIGTGELVPLSAVGSAEGLRSSSVVLDVAGALPAGVLPGAPVDVWAAQQVEGGRFDVPGVIASKATVVRLVRSESVVAGGATTAVEVLVPTSRLARVLGALANDDAISLVPVAIAVD